MMLICIIGFVMYRKMVTICSIDDTQKQVYLIHVVHSKPDDFLHCDIMPDHNISYSYSVFVYVSC